MGLLYLEWGLDQPKMLSSYTITEYRGIGIRVIDVLVKG
jgi:hypothetical protein